MRKKAQFAELDLVIAIALLIGGVIIAKNLYVHATQAPQTKILANDLARSLQLRTIDSLDDATKDSLLSLSDSYQLNIQANDTVARAIAVLIVAAEENGEPALRLEARRVLEASFQGLVPPTYNYNVTLLSNNQRYPIRVSNQEFTTASSNSRLLLSGLQVERPLYGYTPIAYLSSALTTRTRLVPFGGFVGQGDITVMLEMPSDALDATFSLEGDFNDNFTVSVGGLPSCAAVTRDVSVTARALPACAAQLQAGTNTITIAFTGDDVLNHYIGGGYLKATYIGEELYTPTYQKTVNLPGIEGTFNLYDAIHIPGTLQSMELYLHYLSDHRENNNTVFFSLGNATVYLDNDSTTAQAITFNDAQLRTLLDYDFLSNGTTPLRFGYANVSKLLLLGSTIDAVLITDTSGSMNERLGATTRLELAKYVDKLFASNIMRAYPQNTIGLVAYNYEADDLLPPTSDQLLVNQTVDGYAQGGYTCIACGIREGLGMLRSMPANHYRSMLVMSDGEANWCYNEDGYCDGITGPSRWHGNSCDCNDNMAVNQAVAYAQEARNEDIIVYAVAFTADGSVGMARIAGNGTIDDWADYYKLGTTAEELIDIYNDISQRLVSLGRYEEQVINLTATGPSILYPDSYIRFQYVEDELDALRGKLLISGEKFLFGEQVLPLEEQLTDSLVGYWHFNNGFADASGNGHTGTPFNGANIVAGGYSGAGLHGTGVDSYVNVGQFSVPGTQMTLAGWFNIDYIPADKDPRIITKGTSIDQQDWVLLVERGGFPEFRVDQSISHPARLGAPSVTVTTGEWHHIAGVYDDGLMSLYYHGNLVAQQDFGSILRQNFHNVWIGGQPDQPTLRSFPGLLDEVRVYRRALSPDEILQLAGQALPPPGTGCTSEDIVFPRAILPIKGSVSSYSAEHWTESLSLNGRTIYDLQSYHQPYERLGDPFMVGVPPGVMTQGPDTYMLSVADSPTEQVGCSPFDKLFYEAAINSTFSLGQVYSRAEGCTWQVQFPTGVKTITIPQDYTGSSACSYRPGDITFGGSSDWASNTDGWQLLAYKIFSSFDITPQDGALDVDFEQNALSTNIEQQTLIPYMWGPALLEVAVWQ